MTKKELLDKIKAEYVNRENIDTILEVIRDTDMYTNKLEDYLLNYNDDDFFDDFFIDDKPSYIISAVVNSDYCLTDRYVQFDDTYASIRSITTEGAIELIADSIEYIVEVLAELLTAEEDFCIDDDNLKDLLLAYNE